jgi:radical SAM superfamily enzyme YgiQ (UPF0313 family)
MRILLARPPVPHHTIGLKHIMICEPLELEYVAAGLDGHTVEIMDLILERGFERRLRQFRPDVFGTSSYISGVNEAIRLCRAVKRYNLNTVTVVGGVHASQAPEDFADPSVDCIVRGDGTTVMPEIVRALEGRRPLEEVSGLVLPRGCELHATPAREYMPHPDLLPLPRRDLVAHLRHRYYYLFHQPVATVKTTWGCWYRCNFCFTWRITDGHPYSRSPESIATELEQIACEHVYIVDDIFLIQPARLDALARLLCERGIRKKYLVYARADFVAENEAVIAEWAALGLQAVFIGLEATTDPELDAMDKRTTIGHNRRAIAVLQRHCIDIYGSLIAQPDFTRADWDRLKRFIDENSLYYLNISPLTPMPGTRIWPRYQNQLIVGRRAHGLWDLAHTVLPTRQPLRQFYHSLLGVYAHACLNPWRARRLQLPTAPSIFSWKFLRLWFGALKIAWQFLCAHTHHTPRELALAEQRGLEVRTLASPRGVTAVSALQSQRAPSC